MHATILKGIVGGFEFSFFQRNLKELARKALEMCLRVLKESNKSRFDSYTRQEQCIDHIPHYLSGLSCAHFSRNLSRNSCIINKLHHGKCFCTAFTYSFVLTKLTRSQSLARSFCENKLVRKYRTSALSMKKSIFISEILIMMGMGWPVSSDKWKAP